MSGKKQIINWGVSFLSIIFLMLIISVVAAQESNIVGEGPIALPVVETNVAKSATSTPAYDNTEEIILGGLTPRAYLPIVLKPISCPLTEQAQNVANLAINDPEQQRPQMICNDILSQVAHERALDLGTRDYFSHTNPDGFGPNYLVEQAGYDLPDWYGNELDSNNIESLTAGTSRDTAQEACGFLESFWWSSFACVGFELFLA